MKNFLLFVAFLSINASLIAQEIEWPELDKSPMDMATYPREAAFANYLDEGDPNKEPKIKVLYSRPYKKDRNVFGDVVKMGELWRLGANQGTEATFYQNVEIDGVTIPRGRYRLYAMVNKDSWDVVVSTHTFTAGVRGLDESKELARFNVKTSMTKEVREQFTIGFQKINEGLVHMIMEWDKTRAALPINLNAPSMAGEDVSPMDMASFPSSSNFQNFLKPEEVDANEPKIRIVYSRPQMKGRTVFGGLLKYGEMWRLGANETTTINFYADANIGGTDIRRGTYGLFAIPHKDKWEVIIHRNVNSWGTPNHDEETNVASITVPVEKTSKTLEAMSITFDDKGDGNVHILMGWENTMVRVPVMLK